MDYSLHNAINPKAHVRQNSPKVYVRPKSQTLASSKISKIHPAMNELQLAYYLKPKSSREAEVAKSLREAKIPNAGIQQNQQNTSSNE